MMEENVDNNKWPVDITMLSKLYERCVNIVEFSGRYMFIRHNIDMWSTSTKIFMITENLNI